MPEAQPRALAAALDAIVSHARAIQARPWKDLQEYRFKAGETPVRVVLHNQESLYAEVTSGPFFTVRNQQLRGSAHMERKNGRWEIAGSLYAYREPGGFAAAKPTSAQEAAFGAWFLDAINGQAAELEKLAGEAVERSEAQRLSRDAEIVVSAASSPDSRAAHSKAGEVFRALRNVAVDYDRSAGAL